MAVAEVFKDSAGFLAFWDASDEHHAAALHLQRELVRKRRRFVTTDYIVDETATLLLVRHSHAPPQISWKASSVVTPFGSSGSVRNVSLRLLHCFGAMQTRNGPLPTAPASRSCEN